MVQKRLEAGKDFITCQNCDERVQLIDFIEQCLKSDPVAQKILDMEKTATRELDTQALEQILIGHMMATCGEANQVFRPVSMFDYGIDGVVEFKDNDGQLSGKKIYVQLKSGNSYLRTRRKDGREVFDIKNGILDQSACRRLSRHPPDRRTNRRRNNPMDERDALPQEPEGQKEPPNHLRWRGPDDGSRLETARRVFSAERRNALGCEARRPTMEDLQLRYFQILVLEYPQLRA
jgi:hypothetical protein